MLTSLTIAGGLLLSPLHTTFINLISNIPMESNKPEATIKLKHNHSTTSVDDSTSRLSNEVLLTRKQSKAVGKSKNIMNQNAGIKWLLRIICSPA